MIRPSMYFSICTLVLVLGFSVPSGIAKASDKTDSSPSTAQRLVGKTGSSSEWGSGWLDLSTPTDFARGDRLRVKIGGTANNIIVRLLPRGMSADSSDGIIGGAIVVPQNRIVEVVFDTDRKEIIQISVHGGPNPWGKFPLGGSNGSATLEYAELMRP